MEPKDKDNKPIIPTLKASTAQKPQLKIKGLPSAGVSLIERLKQFKKKDLAFILSGLGVLFMAPLAEHFMMAPETPTGALDKNWGIKDGVGGVGGSHTPYEQGLNGLAPGNGLGAGDVITPLNVRDPSSLIMGPSASAQPAAGAPPAPSAPTKSESSDWKDALAQSAAGAAKAATKKASLPVPKSSLGGGTLRGLGALAGGGGAGGGFGGGGAISSQGLAPNHAADSHALTGTHGSGVRGVARGSNSGAGGGFEALKKSAGGAGDAFNRSGPGAAGALDNAAKAAIGGGDAFGGAAGGGGGGDKQGGGNSLKDSKSLGESLAFMRMKAEQDHAIDLEWKLKEKAAMRWPNLEDKMLEEVVMTPIKGLTKAVSDSITKGLTGGGGGPLTCSTDGTIDKSFSVDPGGVQDQCGSSGSGGDTTTARYAWAVPSDHSKGVIDCSTQKPLQCTGSKTPPDPKPTGDGRLPTKAPAPGDSPAPLSAVSSQGCQTYQLTLDGTLSTGQKVQVPQEEKVAAGNFGRATDDLQYANAALNGDSQTVQPCVKNGKGSVGEPTEKTSVQSNLIKVRTLLVGGKPDGSPDKGTTLESLETTNKLAGDLLAKFTKGGKDLTAFETADDEKDPKGYKQAKKEKDWDANVATPLKAALKDADPKPVDAKVGAASAKVKADVAEAEKALDRAKANLDWVEKTALTDAKTNTTGNVDALAKGQYIPLQNGLKSDADATGKLLDQLKQTYEFEKKAVTAARALIREDDANNPGVFLNAERAVIDVDQKAGKNLPQNAQLTGGDATKMADAATVAAGAKGDKEAKKESVQSYEQARQGVVKDLQAAYKQRVKLWDGTADGTAPQQFNPGANAPAGTISYAEKNMRDAVQCLAGGGGCGSAAPSSGGQPQVDPNAATQTTQVQSNGTGAINAGRTVSVTGN